jgi:hypothetical protein
MTTIIPGLREDGWAMRDEDSAAEALGYRPIPRERSDEDDERDYFERHPEEPTRLLAEEADSPVFTNDESYALHLGWSAPAWASWRQRAREAPRHSTISSAGPRSRLPAS